jgi:hypothetical protein
LGGCLWIPLRRLSFVLCNALTFGVHDAEVELRAGDSLIGGKAKPLPLEPSCGRQSPCWRSLGCCRGKKVPRFSQISSKARRPPSPNATASAAKVKRIIAQWSPVQEIVAPKSATKIDA